VDTADVQLDEGLRKYTCVCSSLEPKCTFLLLFFRCDVVRQSFSNQSGIEEWNHYW